MLRIEAVLGKTSDPDLHDKIHELQHRGAVDVVEIAPDDLARRRLLAETDRGEKLAIALPRDQKLDEGAVLLLDDTRAIVVRAGKQRWVRMSAVDPRAAIELGYTAGNLHWRVRFDGADLLVAWDGDIKDCEARVKHLVDEKRVVVSENDR